MVWSLLVMRKSMQTSRFSKVTKSVTSHLLFGEGGLDRPCCTAKAAESRGLFFFSLQLLQQALTPHLQDQERGHALLEAGLRLEAWYGIVFEAPYAMPDSACGRLINTARAHCLALQRANVPLRPKHHFL